MNTGKKIILAYIKEKIDGKKTHLYAIVRSVSRSGMSQALDFYVQNNGELVCITHIICDISHLRRSKDGAAFVQGCDMNMASSILYNFFVKILSGADSYRIASVLSENSIL